MDFSLSDETQQIIHLATEFTDQEIIPAASKHDREHLFPSEIIRQAHNLGLVNIMVPTEYGGSGLSAQNAAHIIAQFGRGCAGIATSIMANGLGFDPFLIGGTKEQCDRFVKPYAEGGLFCSFAQSEPGAGSDVAGIQTQGVKVDGGWIINGQKQWITNASFASIYSVAVKTDPSAGAAGISVFAVERERKGVSVGRPEQKLGQRASDTASVQFEEVFVPDVNLIGGVNRGFPVLMKTLDASRPLVAALAWGIAKRAIDEAVSYARERKQFGQPIASFQMTQAKIAELVSELEATWFTIQRAAWGLDRHEDAGLYSSIAKLKAATLAVRAASEAIQIHGGYGYTTDYPVEKLYRDAKLMEIYEGTNEIQKIVIARRTIGKL